MTEKAKQPSGTKGWEMKFDKKFILFGVLLLGLIYMVIIILPSKQSDEGRSSTDYILHVDVPTAGSPVSLYNDIKFTRSESPTERSTIIKFYNDLKSGIYKPLILSCKRDGEDFIGVSMKSSGFESNVGEDIVEFLVSIRVPSTSQAGMVHCTIGVTLIDEDCISSGPSVNCRTANLTLEII